MTASLIDSDEFAFSDGNGGHVIDLGSALGTDQADVLCVNSHTTVSTPSGFSVAPSEVGGQGAYIFRRVDSGGSTVTITTSGDHPTVVRWSRWGNIIAADDAASTDINGSQGNTSPSHSTAALAETDELVVAFAPLHNFAGSTPTSPSWSAGYTNLGAAASQGSGSSGVTSFVGYKLTAGTAAESPSVSWSNNAGDRYMLTLTFTTSAGSTTYPLSAGGAVTPAGALSKRTDRVLQGAATPVGAVARRVDKSPGGSVAPTGVLARQLNRLLAGAVTPSGAALKLVARAFGGDAPSLGTLTRQVGKGVGGQLTPAGETARTTGKAAGGSVTPTGALSRHITKTLAGAVAPTGAVLKLIARLLGGAATPSGAVTTSITQLRNIDLIVGAPQTKWRAGGPDTKWRTGQPRL